MRVSVVLCTHTMERYDDCRAAAESVLDQSYDSVELVLVSDGDEDVYEQYEAAFGDRDDVLTYCNDENVGLLESRNNGAEIATGDVVAFLDDDAVADAEWVEKLVAAYEADDDRLAVGGRMVPAWVAGKPSFLPEEFYWLVGVTNRGFGPDGDPDEAGEVRNTFGSNISFRRDVFLELGGFEDDIGGRQGEKNLQGGETELCARLQSEYDTGVYYVPDALVAHKIFDYRTDPGWLVDRAFWQGYSKRGMEVFVPESTGAESDFLRDLLFSFAPDRLGGLVRSPSVAGVLQLVFLFVLTGAVGVGYLYGMYVWG
ncbi:glucosyl-dolichyl phosphate glucuronosyltransferase [Haloarcula pellucida]|uniref:Glycosyl transferase family A n=1 Tax=Haloarcula pellucida TaxID=1427151 RepID=A0A830GI23_9EURY|nr:glucosyl-dolichyl phosphate glucuronosyltransferase [Halomicroarcula pellucida]MBX0347307.1 glycosyltransferase [Halomicroarcula pellucida]GGN88026.1 glycosyl transferase family A [Halomicroarcula pellucida]